MPKIAEKCQKITLLHLKSHLNQNNRHFLMYLVPLCFQVIIKICTISGCVAEMRNLGKSQQICDGVVDCPDFSDELYCPYCPEHHFHCGVGKMCIPKDRMCDGKVDCDNGADEKGCCKNILYF